VLYGQDCASYPEALALVERVRAELGIDAEVLTTLVTAPAGAATASNPTTARVWMIRRVRERGLAAGGCWSFITSALV
jgi:hypothetical protein